MKGTASGDRLAWILLVAALLASGGYLAAESARDAGWSDWSFGDAQTLLTCRFWGRDGFLRHRFLFIAHGYARAVRFLDEPPLRHLAHGTDWAVSPLVGPRLYYTHYPSGYLVLPALLWKLGLATYPLLSKYALLLSLSSVALFFFALRRLCGGTVALLACLYYLTSRGFLRYALSLAQMPGDDLLRFAVMAATVWERERPSRRRALLTWLLLFAVAAHGFDAVLFSFFWIVGFDLIAGRRRWRRWALMAAAPLLAYGLQFCQNAWYLGWADAWLDVRETFLSRSRAGTSQFRLIPSTLRFVFDEQAIYVRNVPRYLLPPVLLGAAWAASAAGAIWSWRRRLLSPAGLPVLLLLLAGGLLFPLLVPVSGAMAYQTRQIGPFRSLLVAAALVGAARGMTAPPGAGGGSFLRRAVSLAASLAVFAAAVVLVTVNLLTSLQVASAASLPIAEDDLRAARALLRERREETVYFDYGFFRSYADREHAPNVPQISPEIEYYADAPVLTFPNRGMLVTDALSLWRLARRDAPFRAVVLARSPARLEAVLEELRSRCPTEVGADFRRAGTAWTMDITEILRAFPETAFPPSPPPPGEGRSIVLPRRKNLLAGAAISGSSRRAAEFDAAVLADGRPETCWRLSPHPPGPPDWVLADLGPGRPAAARVLAAQSCRECPEGFLNCALLQGSRDGQDWEEIAPIVQGEPISGGEWRFWDLPERGPFRYYKLVIYSGHGTGETPFRFSTLAELALY